jgi:hypothetical protein
MMSNTIDSLYTLTLKSKGYYKTSISWFCRDNILKMRFILDCFTQSFQPNSENIVYYTSPHMGLWLQTNYPELFAAAFGTATGWGYEDQTVKPYKWVLQSPLERIRMLTLQHWFAKKTYLATDGDGNAARQFFLTFPEPALSEVLRLREDNSAEFNALAAEFRENQLELRNSNQTNTNSLMTLDAYLQSLEQRSSLLSRPPASEVSLSPINLSAAVPYNAVTAVSDVKRTNYFRRKFKDPQMSARQKAHARNLLSLAQVQEQQGNIYMTEQELAETEPIFRPQPRSNWTQRRLRR